METNPTPQPPDTAFTLQDLNNLRACVGTHPTPEGILSDVGQTKAKLIQKIDTIIAEMSDR